MCLFYVSESFYSHQDWEFHLLLILQVLYTGPDVDDEFLQLFGKFGEVRTAHVFMEYAYSGSTRLLSKYKLVCAIYYRI